jgi:hypothetical protein
MLLVSALSEANIKYLSKDDKIIVKEHFTKITKQEFETDIHLIPISIRKFLMSL